MIKVVLAAGTSFGAATVAGVFFGFSVLVMPALDSIPQAAAILGMQEINRVSVRSALMPAMFGTAALTLLTAGISLFDGEERVVIALTIVGAALYLVGSIGVTAFANVPLNDVLARIDGARAVAGSWHDYSAAWTMWNGVRAICSGLAASAFAAAAAMLWRGA